MTDSTYPDLVNVEDWLNAKGYTGEAGACHAAMSLIRSQEKRIAELEAENARLKLFRPYRTELTDCLKSMSIGDKSYYPADAEYEKRRKTILRLAQLAGIKVKTRYVMKDKIEQISVERIG